MRIPPQLARKPYLIGASAAAVAGLIVWVLFPQEDQGREPREREYLQTTAGLLTDEQELRGEVARSAWAGMQEASLATRIKVQYLAITGPQEAANGLSFYNTLGLRQCTVIIAAGPVPAAAMALGSDQFGGIENVAIGDAPAAMPSPRPSGTATVVAVDDASPETVQRRIKEIVTAAADR